MYNEIHEITLTLLGTLPVELEFVYGISDILLFIVVIMCVVAPFVAIYKIWS